MATPHDVNSNDTASWQARDDRIPARPKLLRGMTSGLMGAKGAKGEEGKKPEIMDRHSNLGLERRGAANTGLPELPRDQFRGIRCARKERRSEKSHECNTMAAWARSTMDRRHIEEDISQA